MLTFRLALVAALFIMIFVLAVRQCVPLDPDLWWHLKAGQTILNAHTVPHVDDFSFTKQGSEWVAHEWLSELLIYGVFRLSGLVGLVVLFSSLITFVMWMIYRRCKGRPYAAAVATLMAAAASSPLFGIRPQMITFLLASIYITVLERFVRDGQKRYFWWLAPIMLLWVNLHAGFALGLALIGLYLVSSTLDRKWDRLLPLALLLATCLAVVPLNPNGFRMFSYPYETLTSTSMATFIEEWASPDFHKLTYLPLAILLLATFGVLSVSDRRERLGEIFLVLFTALAALRSVRHIPIFALFAAPVFANNLWAAARSGGWDEWFNGDEPRPNSIQSIINVLLIAAPLVLAGSRLWNFKTHERFFEGIRNPVAAVDFLEAHKLSGPIYNGYGWGGYLIYRLYPEYRVYIDGRADVYGDAFFTETMNSYDGKADWQEPLKRFNVRTILIPPDSPLASLLRFSGNWKSVYQDDTATLFVKAN